MVNQLSILLEIKKYDTANSTTKPYMCDSLGGTNVLLVNDDPDVTA